MAASTPPRLDRAAGASILPLDEHGPRDTIRADSGESFVKQRASLPATAFTI